jgi:mono/diheme cytochrome c family protein
MTKPVVVLFSLLLAVLALPGHALRLERSQDQTAQQATPEQPEAGLVIPEEEKNRKNPLAPNEESLEIGRKIFSSQCIMCHGEKGDGKGDLAVEDNLPVPDFTRAETQKKRTDGEWFYILKQGHGHMPAQGKRLREEQRWNLINFIRTLQEKKAEPELEKP